MQEAYTRWYAMTPQQRDAIASSGGWLIPEPLPEPAEWSSGQPGSATAGLLLLDQPG